MCDAALDVIGLVANNVTEVDMHSALSCIKQRTSLLQSILRVILQSERVA